jgi:dolichyl-phosphate-mannose--protein O-mannosyl transferase
MSPPAHPFWSAWLGLYVDGFRRMTWGRPLWVLIVVKLVVLFVVVRYFFFQPYLKGSDSERASTVATELVTRGAPLGTAMQ